VQSEKFDRPGFNSVSPERRRKVKGGQSKTVQCVARGGFPICFLEYFCRMT